MNLTKIQQELGQLEAQLAPSQEAGYDALFAIWHRLAQMAERYKSRPDHLPPLEPSELSPMGRIALEMSQAETRADVLQTFKAGIDALIKQDK